MDTSKDQQEMEQIHNGNGAGAAWYGFETAKGAAAR
jgi:hypothetical protein